MTALDHYLSRAVQSGIPGLSVALAHRDGLLWTGTAGHATLHSEQTLQSEHLLGIGSITKTFIAVVILQLTEEGRLGLNCKLEAVLGKACTGTIANGDSATIAQLLNHTSGIPSWEDDPRWIKEGRGAQQKVGEHWPKQKPLRYIKNQPPLAAPGERYAYANTNHTLLGLVIEQITGRELVDEIQRRILAPLKLSDIYLEGFQPLPQQRLTQRYHYASPDFQHSAGVHRRFPEVAPGLIDVSASNLSVEWAAGGMVATAPDLARYGAALRNGQLLTPKSMAFMQTWFPINDHSQIGHGVFNQHTSDGFEVIGHMGAVLGYTAALHWFADRDITMAVLANVGTMHSGPGLPSAASVALEGEWLRAVRLFCSL